MKNIIRTLTVILAFTLSVFAVNQGLCEDKTPALTGSCVECHKEIHEQIIADFREDIHNRAGISCEGCHGGNPKIADDSAMDKKYGFVGKPSRENTPQFCGKCHSDPAVMRPFNPSLPTDQVEKYWTSRHGTLLKQKDQKVATCSSCHQAHGILPANDSRSSVYPSKVPKTCSACHSNAEYMAVYGIPTTQYEQYADSTNVHGYALFVKGDLGAPACNDCHGNHGAAPPGVKEVGQVCTQCHAMNGQLFRMSPHKEAFDALGLPECALCHQADPDVSKPTARIHTIVKPANNLVGTGSEAICSQCHSQGDPGFEMAGVVRRDLDSLDHRMEVVESTIERAEQQGMEVSDARWKLKSEVLQARMELRTSVHAFDPKVFDPAFLKADTSLEGINRLGKEAEAEIRSRRTYYIVMTALVALLAIALVLKIRAINRDRT